MLYNPCSRWIGIGDEMEAGKLRHKITIQAQATTRNNYGERLTSWLDVVTVRASKEPLLGNQYFQAEALQSKVEVKFQTRYVAGIDNTMRVQHGNDTYEILSVVDVEGRNRELVIYAKRLVI